MLTRRRLLGSMIAGGFTLSTARHAASAPATPIASPVPIADRSSEIDVLLRGPQIGTDAPFSGAVRITQQGQIIHEAAYGDAEVVERIPNTPATGFQIASITKTFTATLIMQLRDEGSLSLDDPAETYLPGLPNLERDGEPVTIRHLLGHTSGVPDFLTLFDVADVVNYPENLNVLIDRVAAEPLLFTPGSEYAYSNSGYLYLGRVIEAVTGSTWESALAERILTPLDLRDTWLTPPQRPGPIATGYLRLEGFIVPVSRLGRPDLAESAGGLTSTLADLHTWLDAFLAGRVVPLSTVSEMLERGPYRYGLGFEYAELGGLEWLGHYGQTIGFRTALLHQPDLGATMILLSNRQDMEIGPLAELLGRLLASSISH